MDGKPDPVFANPTGLPDGSAIYGIFLHRKGAGVGAFGVADSKPEDDAGEAHMSFVHIEDLKLNALEIQGLVHEEGDVWTGPVGDVLNFKYLHNGAKYSQNSNVLLDAQMALHQYLVYKHKTGTPPDQLLRYKSSISAEKLLSDKFLKWVKGNGGFNPGTEHTLVCGGDAMHHTNKGAVGLRVAHVKKLGVFHVSVKKVVNIGKWDYKICNKVVDTRGKDNGFMAQDARGVTFYKTKATFASIHWGGHASTRRRSTRRRSLTVSDVSSKSGNAIGIDDFGDAEFSGAPFSASKVVAHLSGNLRQYGCSGSAAICQTFSPLQCMPWLTRKCKLTSTPIPIRQCSYNGAAETRMGTTCKQKSVAPL